MSKKTDELFVQLKEEAEKDPNIISLFLTGSRGKRMTTDLSDYDAIMVVKDKVFKKYKNKYKNYGKIDFDLSVMTIKELDNYAAWGGPSAWDRYNFAHLNVDIDKTGKIQQMLDKKTIVPKEKRKDFISGSLDHYLNQVYRYIKNLRDGNKEAAHLEAAESIPPLLDALFALEGRVKPFHKYLSWELINFPLAKLPWSQDKFVNNLIRVLKSADLKTQQEILKKVEHLFKKEGFGLVFDNWGEKAKLIVRFRL